jgi:hypothetical protein
MIQALLVGALRRVSYVVEYAVCHAISLTKAISFYILLISLSTRSHFLTFIRSSLPFWTHFKLVFLT